ncbi:hypothetical protein [Capillimicrobium parvum]|uniref:hypothetical protein n=1 Tax=Capillimicrobium parvum TaxID=2884022 RepID=UPI00216B13AB|nr:hypothetical protein [Capillimicrobium parvum]
MLFCESDYADITLDAVAGRGGMTGQTVTRPPFDPSSATTSGSAVMRQPAAGA